MSWVSVIIPRGDAGWGGDFYLFVGPGTATDVVGAGVSTCAPIKGPR